MCYSPLFGDLYLKDEIARELLAEGDERPDGQRTRTSRERPGGEDDTADIDVDVLTGGATPE